MQIWELQFQLFSNTIDFITIPFITTFFFAFSPFIAGFKGYISNKNLAASF